nr:hypothetical protein [Tanacetum cinerariifolium]
MSKLLYTCFTKLIINYLLSITKNIPRRPDSKLHSSQENHPISKLSNTTNGFYKFGMEVPDSKISDAIKKKAGYTYYIAKKVECEKAKIVNEPEEQHVSPIKSGRGKGFMCYGDKVANVPNKLKKVIVQRTTISLTIAEETVVDLYNEWGQKLKGPAVEDPTVQSLSSSDKPKGSKNETNNVVESDMDLSDDNLDGDDDDDASTKEKYTTYITKNYAARYYKEGLEDKIPKIWSKEVRRYHFKALNDLRIKSIIRIDVKKK